MKRLQSIPGILLLLLAVACTPKQDQPFTVTATVTDQNDQPLPQFSLELIHAEKSWTGIPYLFQVNGDRDSITLPLPDNRPVVVRLAAPGYRPLFTFIKPVSQHLNLSVKLGAPARRPNSTPLLVGNFNQFDPRSGKKMIQRTDGSWETTIKPNTDTLKYAISHFVYGGVVPVLQEAVSFRKDTRAFDGPFINIKAITRPDSVYHIHFDPASYRSIFQTAKPEIRFLNNVPDETAGIAKIYAIMIEDYWKSVLAMSRSRNNPNARAESDSVSFMKQADRIDSLYANKAVSRAITIAQLRLFGSDALSKQEAQIFLQEMPPDSPLWLMHYPALTAAVQKAGLANSIHYLGKIIDQTSSEDFRAEALYDRIKYNFEHNNKRAWYADFARLASNHPDHYRTGYAYKNYAPHSPIAKGKPLAFNRFDGLKHGKSLSLSDIDASYLLLDVWGTWCGACIQEMPELEKIYRQYKGADFTILGIAVDDSKARVRRFLDHQMALPWRQAFMKTGSKKVRQLGIVAFPHYILLGPDRTVITDEQSKLRGDSLALTLNKYLDAR